ncbi:MAG: SGNH/GDSL hydrolase family protein, partial [Acidobacteriota bacterium]
MGRLHRLAGYLLIQALLLVAVLEVGLRVLRPHSSALRMLLYLPSVGAHFDTVPDLESLLEQSMLGWAPFWPRAGFRANSRSFRTHEYTEPGAPGGYRIMILGDSYTFACGGVSFRDMWHTKMSQHLNAGSERPIEVFALGVPATGTMFQLRLWQLEHQRVDPDLVIVAFFVGNDLTDEQDKRIGQAQPPAIVRRSMLARLVRNGARIG